MGLFGQKEAASTALQNALPALLPLGLVGAHAHLLARAQTAGRAETHLSPLSDDVVSGVNRTVPLLA